jgi:RNA polymerase sigma factor (sigma-70 family)
MPIGGESPDAFARAHARLDRWVRSLMVQRGAATHADELAQQVWMVVWQAVKAGTYDPGRASLTTFVYAIAQNTYRNWARSAAREQRRLEAVADAEPAALGAAELVAEAELIDAVRQVIKGQAGDLSEQERVVLGLLARGVGDRELAIELGVAPSTAHARKKAAIEKLRGHLAKFGMDGSRKRG